MDFDWITHTIALGTEFTEEEIPVLVNNGIGAVLDLRAEAFMNPMKMKSYGLIYRRIPVVDTAPPSLQQFLEGIDFLDSNIDNGNKVYVNCREGKGRSATMVIAYLIKSGMAPIEAYKLVKERRGIADPTLIQIYAVKEFERII